MGFKLESLMAWPLVEEFCLQLPLVITRVEGPGPDQDPILYNIPRIRIPVH